MMGLGGKNSMQVPQRPRFLQLHRIHLPVSGLLSLTHRITGALLFFSLPLWLWLWQHSLASADGFAQVQAWLAAWPLRLLVALLIWWLLHHLLAGVRILLLDAGLGVELPQARASATVLLLASPLLLLIVLVAML